MTLYYHSTPPGLDLPGPYPHYIHRDGPPMEQSRSFVLPSRAHIDPPRPLEPRPDISSHASVPALSETLPRRDSVAQPAILPVHRQSLPGIQDILASPTTPLQHYQPPPAWTSPHGANWGPDHGPHRTSPWHPPLAHPQSLPPREPPHPVASYPSRPSIAQGDRGFPVIDPGMQAPPLRSPLDANPHQNPHYLHQGQYQPMRQPLPQAQPPPSAWSPHFAGNAASSSDPSRSYLGIRDIAGEGPSHVFADGSHLPLQVDGETVNPHWGLTKANKARKRLAMACLDCRDKKIKCEPGLKSCVQCEKAKRPCRKATTHQSQTDVALSAGLSIPPTIMRDPRTDFSNGGGELHKRRSRDDLPDRSEPAKKQRSTTPPTNESVVPFPEPSTPDDPRYRVRFQLQDNPYVKDPEVTVQFLECYFSSAAGNSCCLFPKHTLLRWLRSGREPSDSERMVLYALLAVGSLFSSSLAVPSHMGKPPQLNIGDNCAAIATEAVQSLMISNLAAVQTRLLLALYHHARGQTILSRDCMSLGIRAATLLRYHTEQGCATGGDVDFDLNTQQLIEARRRTVWCGLLLELFCTVNPCTVNPQDLSVRLPCIEDEFEQGSASTAPRYDGSLGDMPSPTLPAVVSTISPLASLALIATIASKVFTFIHRSVHWASPQYLPKYHQFYSETCESAQTWLNELPAHMRFSEANLAQSMTRGYDGPFLAMHVMYHLTLMRLNRFAHHASLGETVKRNLQEAHLHAYALLCIVRKTMDAGTIGPDRQVPGVIISAPYMGAVILTSVNVVGAGGHDTSLSPTINVLAAMLPCLYRMHIVWSDARQQLKACEKRFYQIKNVVRSPFGAKSGCWLGRDWGMEAPMQEEFSLDFDCVHGLEMGSYFEALSDVDFLQRWAALGEPQHAHPPH